jgi:hypothetical protein
MTSAEGLSILSLEFPFHTLAFAGHREESCK